MELKLKAKFKIVDELILIIEALIQEIEAQGKTSVTTKDLRMFIHNIETNTNVIGKNYVFSKRLL